MQTYLGYVEGGITPKHEGKMHKQFWVRRELAELDIDAWVGRKIKFERRGKNRYAEAFESPFLPNYIFAEMTPAQFIAAQDVKYLAGTFQILNRADLQQLAKFKTAVEAEFSAAQRVDANSRASVTEYIKGQRLRVVSGPFADMLLSFDRMAKAAHDPWPRIEGELQGIGGKVQFDPLDVKAAE